MTKLIHFDWAIKYLLRNKANFDILEGFLSELLERDIHIECVLESESNKNTVDDKFNRVDLLVQANRQERIIVEVQCSSQWDYLSRVLYGTSKTVTEHLHAGSPYRDIHKVISVSIVFFNLGEGKDYLYRGTTVFKGLHYNDILKLGPNEREVYANMETPADLFPEYYIIKVNQFRESIKNKFDEWVYFLKNEQIEPSFQAKGIQSAAHKLDVLRLSESDRRAYEHYQETLTYEASMVLSHYGRGKQEGFEEGHQEGRIEGREEGIQQTALAMLDKGLDIQLIIELTQLTEKQIRSLKK